MVGLASVYFSFCFKFSRFDFSCFNFDVFLLQAQGFEVTMAKER